MSLELERDEPISEGVRRIVCERIDMALETLTRSARAVSDDAVHEARKRFKEIRGVLRLVRDELGGKIFRRENRTFRDAARPLSVLRDAKALIDSLDALIAHFKERVKPKAFAKFRRVLIERRREARKQVLQKDRAVVRIVRRIRSARKRVERWPLERKGWKAVDGGLQRVYSQGMRAMNEARSEPSDETLHEWRKRTKDLRYGLELLQAAWPETMKLLAEQTHHLTDLLGDDHDLAVLRTVAQQELKDEPFDEAELLPALIDERRIVLQQEAIDLGLKLFEEDDEEFVARLKGYWKAARGSSGLAIPPATRTGP